MDTKTKTELLKLISDVNQRLAEINKIKDVTEKSKAYKEYLQTMEKTAAEAVKRIKEC